MTQKSAPSCRYGFFKAINGALRLCDSNRRMGVHAPYIQRSKQRDAVNRGANSMFLSSESLVVLHRECCEPCRGCGCVPATGAPKAAMGKNRPKREAGLLRSEYDGHASE